MGVDLATYRARIGTFISRRNVSDDDERRKIVRGMWRRKYLSKAIVTTNLKYLTINIASSTHSLEKHIHVCSSIAVGFLPTLQHVRPSGYSGLHFYAGTERFALALVVMSFILIKQLLLLLSGDVEANPGPLGQNTEGLLNMECSEEDIYKIAGYDLDWRVVGRRLISDQMVRDIDSEGGSENDKRDKMLLQWKKRKSHDATYQELVNVLRMIGNTATADRVEELKKSRPQDSPVQLRLKSGDNASRSLKGRYCTLMPVQEDFPPVPTFTFTNLALIKDTTEVKKGAFFFNTIQGSVDDVIETKVTVGYEELLEGINYENKILLLEGRPGCGKTTLTRKISRDWGEGKFLRFIKYLFLVPLRQFYATPINGLNNILDCFYTSDLETEIQGNAGEGVCFILDGLDEYSQQYTKEGCSWFEQLLRGHILPSSIIIITSRPNASVELRKSVHTRGEVLGFLKKQIDEYIDKSFPTTPSKASEVKEYLHNHQNIQHMCYVPLHLVMIMFIHDECQEKKVPLPTTETDVYNLFTRMSLVRYYRKIGKDVLLSDLRSLPSPESGLFLSISKLAYNTTSASRTSISLQDINGEFSISDIANLGIIVVDKKEGLSGREPILSFVHLTNQEFLAAYHVSTLPPDEQLKAIREHIGQPHMSVVLKFFCGITGLQNPDHWTSIMDNALINDIIAKVNLKALHCVFESQNGQRCRELFSKAGGKLCILRETLTLLDYCVVGFCLELASDAVKSIALKCPLTAEGMEIIVQKLTTSIESVAELEIHEDLCDKDKLLALKALLHKLPKVKSLE
eukprot:Em0001g2612a